MREFLKGLDLDKETIDTIMAEHGKHLQSSKEEVETLKKQLEDNTKSLEDLKKSSEGNEELSKKLDEALNSNKDLEGKLQKTKFESAIDIAVANSKTIDTKALKAHLKIEDLKFDEEKGLIGFDEQLKTIKDSYKYLFDDNVATGDSHGNGDTKKEPATLDEALKEKFK